MSLIPRNTSNNTTPFTPFSEEFWDQLFSNGFPFQPITNHPFFSSVLPRTARTVPYSELSVEASGDVRTRLECKEIPEAHLIVAELPGVEKDEVEVAAEEGGVVMIRGADGRFSWRMRLPEDVKVGLTSWSMENGVLTVVVPKYAGEIGWWDWERENERARSVRVVEIAGSDE